MTKRRTPWLMAVLGLLVFVIAACTPSTPTTGSLKVTITGLPSGTNAAVTVKKPDNTDLGTVTATKTFDKLAPGTYTLVVNNVVVGSDTYVGVVSGTPATVVAGSTKEVTVTYSKQDVGDIKVAVNGLPGGTALPTVTATSGTFTKTGTGTTSPITIAGVPVGTYEVSGPDVTAANDFTYGAAKATGIVVTKGGTTNATLTYAAKTGSLNVTIVGSPSLPASGVSVTVKGPSPATTLIDTLTATKKVKGLAPGTYAVAAAPVAGYNITYSVTGGNVPVTAGNDAAITVTYTAVGTSGTLVVNVTGSNGGAVTVHAKPASGTEPTPLTRTGDGTVTFTGLAFGTYSVSAASIKSGTYVDTFYFTPTAASVNHNAATTNASVTLVNRGGTGAYGSGRVFLAGNGAFYDEGSLTTIQRNAVYSITDTNLGSASPALDTVFNYSTPLSNNDGYFRVTFDAAGNMFIIYQNLLASGAGNARILKISEANLRATPAKLAETDAGNVLITGTSFVSAAPASYAEPADIAFDEQGNMWLANDKGGLIACYKKDTIASSTSGPVTVNTADQKIVDASAAGVLRNVHSIIFDRSGNLWFGSDKTSTDTPPSGDLAFKSRLGRINKSLLTCSGGPSTINADIILDVSNNDPVNSVGGPVVKPVALALAPDGKSIWVADYGGSDAGDKDPESIVQIPLNAANTTPGAERPAIFGFRLYTADYINFNSNPAYVPLDQIQQPFGLAFDKGGDIWVASNNNIAGTNPALPAPPITDSKGKLWQLKIPTTSFNSCMNFAPADGAVSTLNSGKSPCNEDLSAYPGGGYIKKTVSAPLGVGFVGISFNIAPTNAPMYVRPTP